MATELLTAREVDQVLRYPRGRSAKLARDGMIRCVRLPDGEVRFLKSEIKRLIESGAQESPVRERPEQ